MTGNHNKKNKGFTLIETLISLGLFSILVTIAIGGFVRALHTQHEVADLISAQSNVSLAVEQMAREIRTGYLFCHANDNQGLNSPPLGVCGCGTPQPNDSPWTCSALQYYNAQSEQVTYGWANGTLTRADNEENSGIPEALTGNDVTVKYLTFKLFGQLEGDHWTPRITILLGISASSSDPALVNDVLNFETTVSARQIDCTKGGSC